MVVTCIAALPTASATHVEVTLHQFDSYRITVQLTQGATFVFGWSANHALTETFTDPHGAVIKAEAGSSTGGMGYMVTETGSYNMTWTNLQASDATLKVDYYSNINNLIDIGIAVMIIGLIVLVVVIVVILLVVMRKPKAPPQMPQQYQQPPPPPPPGP